MQKVSNKKALLFFEDNFIMIRSLEAKNESGCAEKCLKLLRQTVSDKAVNDKESIWHDRKEHPKDHKDIIVRDVDGREYDSHYWTGYAYYSYVESDDDSRDGWCSDVDIVEWKYKIE